MQAGIHVAVESIVVQADDPVLQLLELVHAWRLVCCVIRVLAAPRTVDIARDVQVTE